MTQVVEAVGSGQRFGATHALDGVGLTVAPGESHALVGRNGAGKSTLVSILTGLHRPDAGQIRFNGQPAPPASEPAAWRRHVACVYQKSRSSRPLGGREPVLKPAGPGWRRPDLLARVAIRAGELLDAWGIEVDPGSDAGTLTVEQRQTVEIARALSLGTRFIILDEPTAQLDGAGIARLFTGCARCARRAWRSCSSRTTSRRCTRSARRSPCTRRPARAHAPWRS